MESWVDEPGDIEGADVGGVVCSCSGVVNEGVE